MPPRKEVVATENTQGPQKGGRGRARGSQADEEQLPQGEPRRSARKKTDSAAEQSSSRKTKPGRGAARNGAEDHNAQEYWSYVPVEEDTVDENAPTPTEDIPSDPRRPRRKFTPPGSPPTSPEPLPPADSSGAAANQPGTLTPAGQDASENPPAKKGTAGSRTKKAGAAPKKPAAAPPPPFQQPLLQPAPPPPPFQQPLLQPAPPPPFQQPLLQPQQLAPPLLQAPPLQPAPAPAKTPLFLEDVEEEQDEPAPGDGIDDGLIGVFEDDADLPASLQELTEQFQLETEKERELATEHALRDEAAKNGEGSTSDSAMDVDDGLDDGLDDDDDDSDGDGDAEKPVGSARVKSKPGRVSKQGRQRIDEIVNEFKGKIKALAAELGKPERVIWALTGLLEALARRPNLFNMFVRRWCLQNPAKDGEPFSAYVRRFVEAYRKEVGPMNERERETLRERLTQWLALYDKEVAKEVVTRGEVYKAMLKMKVQFLEIAERNRLLYNIVSFGGIACAVPGDLKGQAANCFWTSGAHLEKIVTENRVELRKVLAYVGAWTIAKGSADEVMDKELATDLSAKRINQRELRKITAPLVGEWEKEELKTGGTQVSWVEGPPQCLKLKVCVNDWPAHLDIIERDRHLVWNTNMCRATYVFFHNLRLGDASLKRPHTVPLTKLELSYEKSTMDGDYGRWLKTPLWKNVDGDVLLTVAEVLEAEIKPEDKMTADEKKKAQVIRRAADAARNVRQPAIDKRKPPVVSRTLPKGTSTETGEAEAENENEDEDEAGGRKAQGGADNDAKGHKAAQKKSRGKSAKARVVDVNEGVSDGDTKAKKKKSGKSGKARVVSSAVVASEDEESDVEVPAAPSKKKKASSKPSKSRKRAETPVIRDDTTSSSSSSDDDEEEEDEEEASSSSSDSDSTTKFIKVKARSKGKTADGDRRGRPASRPPPNERERKRARREDSGTDEQQLGGGHIKRETSVFGHSERYASMPPQPSGATLGVPGQHHMQRGQSPMAPFSGRQTPLPQPQDHLYGGDATGGDGTIMNVAAAQRRFNPGPHMHAHAAPYAQQNAGLTADVQMEYAQPNAVAAGRSRARQQLQDELNRARQLLANFDSAAGTDGTPNAGPLAAATLPALQGPYAQSQGQHVRRAVYPGHGPAPHQPGNGYGGAMMAGSSSAPLQGYEGQGTSGQFFGPGTSANVGNGGGEINWEAVLGMGWEATQGGPGGPALSKLLVTRARNGDCGRMNGKKGLESFLRGDKLRLELVAVRVHLRDASDILPCFANEPVAFVELRAEVGEGLLPERQGFAVPVGGECSKRDAPSGNGGSAPKRRILATSLGIAVAAVAAGGAGGAPSEGAGEGCGARELSDMLGSRWRADLVGLEGARNS
ncbi:hypothetical protein AURDEDRAFT_125810 [Auricularia subglabra TFB-10046 SS5]|nr:hypothetical protein AURDEDRAFT_125810 [Auricularia subglabra TFB-10046 SS5]